MGATSATATVTAADDNVVEGDETITVVARRGTDQVGTTLNITIEANDAPSWERGGESGHDTGANGGGFDGDGEHRVA